MSAPLIGSLCTGYGGLDMAVEQMTGGETAWVADSDAGAAAILAHHRPATPNLGDITAIDWAGVRPVGIITAGFPCQDISSAGKRVGISGKRSGIWKNVAEAVRRLRPGLVVLENVAAIRSRGLDVVAGDLAAIGYDARWTCLRAGDPETGAPHPRDRWFCLAHPAAQDAHLPAWFQRRPPVSGEEESGRARADAGGRGGVPLPRSGGGLKLLPTPRATMNGHRHARETGEHRSRLEDLITLLPTPAARDWKSGASNLIGRNARPLNEFVVNVLPDRHWVTKDGVDYGPAIRRWENVLGRPAPCPTEPGAKGNRRLSPLFTEWMMGAPEGHVTAVPGLTRPQMLRALGAGAVPQQAVTAISFLLGPTDVPS